VIARLAVDLGKADFTGIFGADMKVELLNDGPVTIVKWIVRTGSKNHFIN